MGDQAPNFRLSLDAAQAAISLRAPMNTDQVLSLLRTVLKLAGASFVTKGITDSNTLEIIVSGVVALAGVIWSFYAHKADATAITTTATGTTTTAPKP